MTVNNTVYSQNLSSAIKYNNKKKSSYNIAHVNSRYDDTNNNYENITRMYHVFTFHVFNQLGHRSILDVLCFLEEIE